MRLSNRGELMVPLLLTCVLQAASAQQIEGPGVAPPQTLEPLARTRPGVVPLQPPQLIAPDPNFRVSSPSATTPPPRVTFRWNWQVQPSTFAPSAFTLCLTQAQGSCSDAGAVLMRNLPLSSRQHDLTLPAQFWGRTIAWSVGVCTALSDDCSFASVRHLVWDSLLPPTMAMKLPRPATHVLLPEPTPFEFGRWLGDIARSPRCANCHGMEANNATMQQHRAGGWLPFDADVTAPVNCSNCHQTQPNRRDPCTMAGEPEAVAACARGVAQHWRAPATALRLDNRSDSDLCSVFQSWAERGAGIRSYEQRLQNSRARIAAVPAHAWALERIAASGTNARDRIEQWVMAGFAFNPQPDTQLQSAHCAPRTAVGLQWGDDAWNVRAFRDYPAWDAWVVDPQTDQIRRQPKKKSVEFFPRADPGAPNMFENRLCIYEWFDESATAVRPLGGDQYRCPGGNAHRAIIRAPKGTVVRVYENLNGLMTHSDWAWAEIELTTGGTVAIVTSFEHPPTAAAPYRLTFKPGTQPLNGRIRSYQVFPGPNDNYRLTEWSAKRPTAPAERLRTAQACQQDEVATGVDRDSGRLLCLDAWSRRTTRTQPSQYPERLTGLTAAASECPPGQVMTGFRDNARTQVECVNARLRAGDYLSRHASMPHQRQGVFACPPGQPMVGVVANGLPICREIRRAN